MTLSDLLHRPATVSLAPLRYIRSALAAWHQRRALSELPPERLDDIGIDIDTARREAERPFWDVPSHWLR